MIRNKNFGWLVASLVLGLFLIPANVGALELEVKGKIWSIEPGAEANTYDVKWGDEECLWTQKAWQSSDYQELGPEIYTRWAQPGLPYPWEMSLDERTAQDGREVHDRAYTALYFNEFGDNYMTHWALDLTSPDGTERNKDLFEWLVAYRYNMEGLPKKLQGKVRVQYMFTFIAPNDFRGLGINTTLWHGDKFNDEFLYTPSARRVRRLPQAARQDIIPGSFGRWEDFPQVKPFPDINYNIIGETIYKGPESWFTNTPEGTNFGWSMDTPSEQVNIGIDGLCEPVHVMDVIPTTPNYWYARQRRLFGMITGGSWYEEAYDSKGELFRVRMNRRSVVVTDPRMRNPEGPFTAGWKGVDSQPEIEDWQLIWGGEHLTQMKTGFTMSWYMKSFWINLTDMPRDIVNLENLRKEPVRKIRFW